MKLYYAPGTCALAPHIVLEWLGVSYDLERVALGSDDYKKINPLGTVPSMTDGDDTVMTQSDAILKYLAYKHPEADFGSDGSLRGEYEVNRWLAFMGGDFHPAFFPFFNPQRYTVEEDEASIAAVKAAANNLIARVLKHLDNHLEDKNFMLFGRRSIVDASVFAQLRWVALTSLDIGDYPNAGRLLDTMRADESVQRAMERQGIG